MEKNKTNITNVTKDGIVKGKIANAITSAAKNHIVATTDDIYDVNFKEYQDSINKRLNGSISELKSDITKIKGDVTTMNSKITNMQGDITNIKGNITTLNSEVAGVKSDVAKTKNDIVTINGKITNIQGNITTINREISSIQNDITNVKNNIVTINREISNIHGDITTIKNNITILNNEIIALQNSITSIQTNINTINNEISGLHGDISEINNKITSIQDDISGIKELIPIEATTLNQLADKQFVIDLIHSTCSAFRGNWDTWDDVPTRGEDYPEDGEGNKTPRQGDYIVIVDASEYVGEDTGKTYDGTWRFVYEGEWETNGKNGWQPEYQINEKPEIVVHFRKKKEGENISTPITDVKVSDKNTLLKYPELDYSEFVNGGYWNTNITTLREITGETTVYYITPFMTITDNRILLKICYENGWSSSPDYLTLREIQNITDEMVTEASKKLSLIEDEQGNLIEVFDSIIFVEEGENPIVMARYNLYEGLCWDKYDNEYNITDCCCYSKDGKRYSLDEIKYGNCFYELESWAELPYFTGITSLGDGETYRVFLDYSHIQDINLENITNLPAYTLFRCVHLENIYIPSGLTDIETYALASCDGLQSLVVDENNPKYTSRDSNGNECNCIVEKPVTTRGTRSAINNQLTLIQGCNVTTLPDNIKHIASGAFDECTRLTGITLPDGLLTMGDNVFRGCTALSGTVIVPNTVESIGESTFRNCIALQGVNINVSVISEQLFKDCTSLSNVTLGNNVTTIGNQAFMNDSSLTAITIPDSVTIAGTNAFSGCDLRSVNTNNIETIETNMFACNFNLSSITMTDSTVTIGQAAFMDCVSLTSVTIPQNVRSLSPVAFIHCNNLQRIVWDVNDTALGGYTTAFAVNKETITSFEFGEHCTVIPNVLCSGMINIEQVTIPNTINVVGASAFQHSGLININIPDNVAELGNSAFGRCESLQTVTIGRGITLIPIGCFGRCSSLETVDLSNNPNKINLQKHNIQPDAFNGCSNLSLIIVPDDLITDYRESRDWYEYRELIFGSSVYTITFDSMGGETTPSTQNVRCGGYVENPGTVHKDLYEFEYWEDEDGNEWDFEENYVTGDMTLYAHYREVKAIMVKSISNDITNINISYVGSYDVVDVQYSYDGLNWYNMEFSQLNISAYEGYSDYVYLRGYNPNGFSRGTNNLTRFYITNGQCNLIGNIMYLKDYNQELSSVGSYEFYRLFQDCSAIINANDLILPATTLTSYCYSNMFNGCVSLTTAPELPATTLTDWCYNCMFYNCYNLNHIKCLAINGINTIGSTNNWVQGVQTNSGTFIKHPFATGWSTCSTNGIPCNWTVEDAVIE